MKSRLIYLLRCKAGTHSWKQGHSRGYGGESEGSKTCRICGQYNEWWSGKRSYSDRMVRPGDFSELKELGIDA